MLFAAVILVAAIAGAAATGANDLRRDDPRCAGYSCPFAGLAPPVFNSFDVACNGTVCPRCLTGSDWQDRIASIGGFQANRQVAPVLAYNAWLSAEMTVHIARILLQEVLGFDVRVAPMFVDGSMDVLCCPSPLVVLEKWPTGRFPSEEGYF